MTVADSYQMVPGIQEASTTHRWIRNIGPDTSILLARLAGFLYLAAGVGAIALVARTDSQIPRPTLAFAMSSINVIIGLAMLVVAQWMNRRLLMYVYPAFAYVLIFYAGVALTINLYATTERFLALGTMLYLLAPIFGFYLLNRLGAILVVVSIGIEFAILMSLLDVLAPVGQWLFFMAMLATASLLVGTFVRRADSLAESEKGARHELADINATLEQRVSDQVNELERLNRLRRFLSPQIAEAVMATSDDMSMLNPHRREIAVFFCDLRGFTKFAGSVEPEEVLEVLNAYYDVVGNLLRQWDGTVGGFAGDGIMAYFNDPVPCAAPADSAVEMALRMCNPMADLMEQWTRRGYDLGYGVGIALGHATLGMIGFEGRNDYTPLGTVVNLGARLCAEASSGQILIDQRTLAAVSQSFTTNQLGALNLKGFTQPIQVSEVLARSDLS
jgi:class 3 adenylate cyclase